MVFKFSNRNEDKENVGKLYFELTKGIRTHQKIYYFFKATDILKSRCSKTFLTGSNYPSLTLLTVQHLLLMIEGFLSENTTNISSWCIRHGTRRTG